MSNRLVQNISSWTAVSGGLVHIFCCGLPALFSILSLLGAFGLSALIPHGVEAFHEAIHDYELYIWMVSLLMLAIGWAAHAYSLHMNCHEEVPECGDHKPCDVSHRNARIILVLASVLFASSSVMLFMEHFHIHHHH